MKKIIYSVSFTSMLVFIACSGNKEKVSENKKTFSEEEIKTESKKANDFLIKNILIISNGVFMIIP